MLMKITSTPETDPSTGNDDPAPTQPETEAQDMAKSLMDDETCSSVGRHALGRGRWTMTELKYAAARDKNGGPLRLILKACGQYSKLCPYCFNVETGEGKDDNQNHSIHS